MASPLSLAISMKSLELIVFTSMFSHCMILDRGVGHASHHYSR
jgi:hypothetical protein